MEDSKKEENDADYLHFYQKLKFEEDSCNPINAAGAKRMQLILNQYQSSLYNETNASCYLLKNDLADYSKIVDNKSGLNNYATYINAVSSLSSSSSGECDKWQSKLAETGKHILEKYAKIDYKPSNEDTMRFFVNLQKNTSRISTPQLKMEKNADMVSNKINYPDPVGTMKRETHSTMPTWSNSSTTNRGNVSKTLGNDNKLPQNESANLFRTAATELKLQNLKKYGNKGSDNYQTKECAGVKKSLGGRTRTVHSKFVPPIKNNSETDVDNVQSNDDVLEDEKLKGLDPKMIELIRNEIMDNGNPVAWDDIAGLHFAKTTIQEIVVWPLLRPDIFTGLRRPPKGILLFGPPGTGKTLIGKCIASQLSSTFFSISASSLTSKWIGDSEKLVRTLFAVARVHQPAVIFIDEIDSLLSQRSDTEHESSRRIKTEFLVQLDGATTHEDDRILVIGATNRPQELDEAARRRLVKKLYIPLPEFEARCQIVTRLMRTEKNNLSKEDVYRIAKLTDGYSGADMKNLCQEASLGPIRSIDFSKIGSIESHEVRPVTLSDFEAALKHVRSSVSSSDLNQYLEWDKVYGSSGN